MKKVLFWCAYPFGCLSILAAAVVSLVPSIILRGLDIWMDWLDRFENWCFNR